MTKWNEFSAYQVAREIIAENPALLHSVISGVSAGYSEALAKMQQELAWANMATDAALALATKRSTPENIRFFNTVLTKRFQSFGNGVNELEREFLASVAPK